MDELGHPLHAGRDIDDVVVVVGPGLVARLAELAAAAAACPDGDTARLADRGFTALSADVAAVLPRASRVAFLALCRDLRRAAARRLRR